MKLLAALNQCTDILFKPVVVFKQLAERPDLLPAGMALGVTSILLCISTIVAELNHIPLAEKPVWDFAGFRWFQACVIPIILGVGCLLCAALNFLLVRWFHRQAHFRSLLAISAPALLVPIWSMLWPTDLAVSLGLLDASMAGFPGLWTRELAPGLTVMYTLFLLWLGLWQAQKMLLRESFAVAVLSLIPTLGWWALILR